VKASKKQRMVNSEYIEMVRQRMASAEPSYCALGLASEVGELAGLHRAAMASGTTPDEVEVLLESGDALYYLTGEFNRISVSPEFVAEVNKAKLDRRAIHGKDKVAETTMATYMLAKYRLAGGGE
jgi:hypothetical protein